MQVQIYPDYAIHCGGLHIFVHSSVGKKAIEVGAIEPATEKFDCTGEVCWQFTHKTNA